jgi:hypothetical protein
MPDDSSSPVSGRGSFTCPGISTGARVVPLPGSGENGRVKGLVMAGGTGCVVLPAGKGCEKGDAGDGDVGSVNAPLRDGVWENGDCAGQFAASVSIATAQIPPAATVSR